MIRWLSISILIISPLLTKGQYKETSVYLSLESERDIKKENFQAHLAHLEDLMKQSILLSYGRLENGDEFLLFNLEKLNSVNQYLENDPLIKEGFFKVKIFHTNIRRGNFCAEKIEAPQVYNFVWYTTHITKYNIQQVPQLLKLHDDYIEKIFRTGNVLAEGIFSNSDGGFLIIKGSLGKEVIMNDPTFQAGFIIPEISNIFMPADTFCKESNGNQKN